MKTRFSSYLYSYSWLSFIQLQHNAYWLKSSSLEDLVSVMIIICITSDGFSTLLNTEVDLRTEKLREVEPLVEGSPSIFQCAESKIPRASEISVHGSVSCCHWKPFFIIMPQCLPTVNTHWSSALWMTLVCACEGHKKGSKHGLFS